MKKNNLIKIIINKLCCHYNFIKKLTNYDDKINKLTLFSVFFTIQNQKLIRGIPRPSIIMK